MTDLDRELRALATGVDWAPTPDLTIGLAERLRAEPAPARRRRVPLAVPRRIAIAIAVFLIALAAVGTTVEPVRAEIERLLGIAGGEKVVRLPKVGTGPRLDLGRLATLDQARRRFDILEPHPGPPLTEVRLGGDISGDAVSLLYGPDTILTENPGASVYPGVKQIAGQVRVEFADVNGAQGIWIAKGPRLLLLTDDDGRTRARRAALPGAGVLLWERSKVALRLETRRGFAYALALARRVR